VCLEKIVLWRSCQVSHLFSPGAAEAGAGRVDLPETPVYNLLDGGVAGLSILEGVGSTATSFGNPVGLTETRYYLIGTRDAGTGAVTITDTNGTMVDSDGYGLSGDSLILSADLPTEDPGLQQLSLRQFQWSEMADDQSNFVGTFFTRSTDQDGSPSFAVGVIGVSTLPIDMPATGTAVMTGRGLLNVSTSLMTSDQDGAAQVTADFTNGLVNMTFASDPSVSPLLLDSVNIVGMEITENAFSGGTTFLSLDGEDVTDTALGTIQGQDGAGLFFGPATGGRPAEVGGFLQIQGENADLRLYYAAK